MAEKLVAFTGTNWQNFGLYSFYFSGDADGESDANSSGSCPHKARKYFSISGTVQTAVLNLGIYWDLVKRSAGVGSADFLVYLRKPDDTLVQLASHSEDATIDDNSGTLQLCDDQNIAANLDQVGQYSIEVWCTLVSAWYAPIDEPVYVQSYGGFSGPPSLLVTERFTKTVIEAIGHGEIPTLQAGISTLEVAGLGESYSMIPTGTADAAKFEKMGLQEVLAAAVAVEKAEGAGLAESLTRTYGYRQHDVTPAPEEAGLFESLVAKWQTGNFTATRDILDEADVWEEIPGASTEWEDA